MAAVVKHKPAWLESLMFAGIRTGFSSLTIGDLGSTLYAARRIGRALGGSWMNKARLQRAIDNIALAYPDATDAERREYALRSYEHIFALGVEVANMPRRLSLEGWVDRVELGDVSTMLRRMLDERPIIFLTGHCGNWELCGYTMALLGFRIHALYRPFDLRPLDAWVRQVRGERGMTLMDKFGAMHKLPEVLERGDPVGIVADQNAGVRGLHVPFFGRLASTYKAMAILALRYDAVVVTCVATRTGRRLLADGQVQTEPDPMRYHMYVADIMTPEDYRAQPDPSFYITARFRRALEECIRKSPEQTLWMHRFWKSRPPFEMEGKPFPARLEARLRNLPWMTDEEMRRIKEHSLRDTTACAAARGSGGGSKPEPEPDPSEDA
ncbi:MAG: lysophospholipid acyltransferase family protein [Phycisphaerales bacterium]